MVTIDFPDLPDLPDWFDPRQLGSNPADWPVDKVRKNLTGDFWDTVDKVDQVIIRYNLPVPLMRPTLEQFSLVDSDRLREVANVWDVVGEEGLPAAMATRLSDAIDGAVHHTSKRWTGEAQTNFAEWMRKLRDVLREFEGPAELVAVELNSLADQFELTKMEVFGLITGMIGLVMALIAFTDPEVTTKLASGVMAVLGLVLTQVSNLVTLVTTVWPRYRTACQVAETLRDEISGLIPRDVPETALRREDWQRQSPDPTS